MRRLPGMLALPLLTFVLTGCPMTDSHSNEQDVPQAPRTTKDIIRDGNHLKDEPSLYLQQHAHNPLDWYPWGEAALAKAKRPRTNPSSCPSATAAATGATSWSTRSSSTRTSPRS